MIDIALGVFPDPPRQTQLEAIFQERFGGIVRQGHPALTNGTMSLEAFSQLSHGLMTVRRDRSSLVSPKFTTPNCFNHPAHVSSALCDRF